MLKWLREIKTDQKAFTLMEVVVACALIAILSSIAIPKFSSSVITANTVKVKSDLQTIDTAIILYMTDKGNPPSSVDSLSDYIIDVQNLKPPTGKECRISDSDNTVTIAANKYEISVVEKEYRATCDGRTASDYGK